MKTIIIIALLIYISELQEPATCPVQDCNSEIKKGYYKGVQAGGEIMAGVLEDCDEAWGRDSVSLR